MDQETYGTSDRKTGKPLAELGDIVAFVGHEVEFSGVLTYKGNVRIDGTFDGEIETNDTLFVGEQANVKAQIRAGSVIASGRIKGDITAEQRVELKTPAVIDASISTPKLSMDNGVIFNGKITMGSQMGKGKGKGKRSVAPIPEVTPSSFSEAKATDTEAAESDKTKDQEDSQTEAVQS